MRTKGSYGRGAKASSSTSLPLFLSLSPVQIVFPFRGFSLGGKELPTVLSLPGLGFWEMEGSESEAIFESLNLNPQLFVNEVLNLVDDLLDGAFDFYQQ